MAVNFIGSPVWYAIGILLVLFILAIMVSMLLDVQEKSKNKK